MSGVAQKPIFHVILSDRDEWAVEVEWPDGILERIVTLKDHSSAAEWVSTRSEIWLQVREILFRLSSFPSAFGASTKPPN
jgi:hypothetical protein